MHITITRRIPQLAQTLFEQHGHTVYTWGGNGAMPRAELLQEVAEADGLLSLLTDKVDAELLAAAPKLKVVSNFAVGYDNLDVAALTAHKIPAGNTPDVLTETTADTAFMLLMAAARKLVPAQADVKAGKWHTWEPLGWIGQEIHGATLGIIGFGRIGQAIARRGTGFGMKLVYYNRSRRPDAEAELKAQPREFDALLQESDFVVLCTALTAETHHLIGERELAMMKPSAVVVNIGRGGLIDPSALYVALRANMIAAAGLDVTEPEPLPADHPLLTLDNCLVVPHIGSATYRTREQIARLAAENILAGLRGERLPHCINPEVYA
ncbi:MAG: 2-hydroxyacid dehydrogenase [Phototrophicaceae bacterium]